MTDRPQPPPDTPFDMSAPPPDGYRWELRPDTQWRIATLDEVARKRCRRPGCGHRPAAALWRSSTRRGGRKTSRGSFWLYCSDHMYGRVIVDGVVMLRRGVPDEPLHPRSPAAILADLRELAARPDDGECLRFLPADARVILSIVEASE